jgi:hypothetical protein
MTLTLLLASFWLSSTQADDLAKQAQNPVADLISLPLQNNTNFLVGPNDRAQNVFNVQPAWPFQAQLRLESHHPYDRADHLSAPS